VTKHKRDKEQIELELDDKRSLCKRYENEFKDITNSKLIMKKQIEEYENKIKKLIKEFEDESKKHIHEVNDIHEQYRGYKSSA
jgi:sugar-specific transcriptional regulator TrmB